MSRERMMRVAWTLCILAIAAGLAVAETSEEKSSAEGSRHEEVDWSVSCLECHQEVTPEATEEWEKGRHGQVNIGCFVCHGDGVERFAAKPDAASCISCHDNKTASTDPAADETCYSCHGGHSLRHHHK